MLKGEVEIFGICFQIPFLGRLLGTSLLSLPAHLSCVSSPSHWWWTWLSPSLKSPPAWLWSETGWRNEAWSLEPASDPAGRRWHRRRWSHPCSMAPWVPCTVDGGQGPHPSLCGWEKGHIRLPFSQGVPAGPTSPMRDHSLPSWMGSSVLLGVSGRRVHSKP